MRQKDFKDLTNLNLRSKELLNIVKEHSFLIKEMLRFKDFSFLR